MNRWNCHKHSNAKTPKTLQDANIKDNMRKSYDAMRVYYGLPCEMVRYD